MRGDLTMAAEAGVLHFEDGGRGHEPRNAGSLYSPKKARR